MGIKTIPLSRLEADPRGTLNACADSGEALVVQLPDQRLLAIQPLDPDDDDSLMSELLESNPAFQALVSRSKASPRKPFALDRVHSDLAKPIPWPEIHELEIREEYPAAIDALEGRLAADPDDAEAVIRLGFNLWYAAHEDDRMQKMLPVEKYARRFMDLFERNKDRLSNNADFCWAFGLGMSMFWFEFPGATEAQGMRLLDRARSLDPFWAGFDHPDQQTLVTRFKGRGIFASYYAAA